VLHFEAPDYSSNSRDYSSKIATTRVKPAEARAILNGKQQTV
jgi:hypothetical protein